ncbi:hypothetical protein H2200_005264 [Cladophialophora chaetospira]|uniref:Uncharacterized protein n=1 Tax=Cladophialophora chaetospira TaxID=386627 RepID=A0AA39CJF4_9EURO|nr:hypothetical protein H2200_005264 [Cladophialophora chaetospira]
MYYVWNPDLVLHILDPEFEQLPCQGLIRSADADELRCTRYRSDKSEVKARQLLATLSQGSPFDVSSDQLRTLARLCLCAKHRKDEETVYQELERRLEEARRLYSNFEEANTRFNTFREDICNELGINIFQSDAFLLRRIQKLNTKISSREQDITGLKAKLKAEQNSRKMVDSDMKCCKMTMKSLDSRYNELEMKLKDSESTVVQREQSLEQFKLKGLQLQGSLESAEAQVHLLQETCECAEAKAHQQEAEVNRLKSESAEKEMSSQELKSSIANLQAQLQETKTLETTVQCRVKELQEAISQTEAQAWTSQQSTARREEQLTSTEQRLSEQIRIFTTLHEQNFSAGEKLATTTLELQKCQNQLVNATTTITQLANAALQRCIDEERGRADTDASKTWKVRMQHFHQKRSSASRQRHEHSSTNTAIPTPTISSPDV